MAYQTGMSDTSSTGDSLGIRQAVMLLPEELPVRPVSEELELDEPLESVLPSVEEPPEEPPCIWPP